MKIALSMLFLVAALAACAGASVSPAVPSAVPSVVPSPATTGSSLPIPIPDIPSGDPLHAIGEPIMIGDSVFTFTGLDARPDGLYAAFEVQSGSLDGAQLLAGSALVPLRATTNGYEAGPLDAMSDPATGQIALVVGDVVIPLAPSVAP